MIKFLFTFNYYNSLCSSRIQIPMSVMTAPFIFFPTALELEPLIFTPILQVTEVYNKRMNATLWALTSQTKKLRLELRD